MKSKLTLLSVVLCSLVTTGCFERTTTSNNVSGADSTPQVTTLSPGGKGFASLSWSAIPGEQTGFYVEGSSDNATFQTVAIVPDGTTSATISSLANATTYYFRVRGYNASGISQPSPVVTANVP